MIEDECEAYATRLEAARLAVQAAGVIDDHVDASVVFSLAIFFESWLVDGGDATQAKMKLLPEETARILTFLRPTT